MKQMFKNIHIIPLEDTLIHEGTVGKWADKIAENISHDGFVKHPIIVTRVDDKYICLDGMHRVSALRKLQSRDILAYIVDYFDDNIKLFGWDALLLSPIRIMDFLNHFIENKKFRIISVAHYQEARELLAERKIYLFMMGRKEVIDAVAPQEGHNIELEEWISCFKNLEQKLDEENHRIIYIADSISLNNFRDSNAHVLFARPAFDKDEVIKRTLEKKIFPRKSTRHIIPGRPLRVDVDLTLLKEDIDISVKNQLLQSRLRWAWENNMVRYYPDSVFVFSD